MPEGHVIHRLADTLTTTFAGRPVRVSSPQGRFADEAARLDARDLVLADAWGKHLFVTFDVPEPAVVQIHLGLIGKLMIGPDRAPWGQVRLRITDGVTAADLRGPQTCRLIGLEQQAAEIAKLGPDPLRADADPERGWAVVHRSTKSIAALLMDQKVAAGVGNIYRAEVLYRHRLDPFTPGNRIAHETWLAMWADFVTLMHDGVDSGRIDTVTAEHTPEAMDRPPRVDRHGGEVYVYRRAGQHCHVCGTEVRTQVLAGRNLYWCPTCQVH